MPSASKDEPAPLRSTIMVVDDQPQNVKLVSDLLTVAMGYEVIQASSGEWSGGVAP